MSTIALRPYRLAVVENRTALAAYLRACRDIESIRGRWDAVELRQAERRWHAAYARCRIEDHELRAAA